MHSRLEWVKLGAINNILTQGASSTTGNNTDIMIQGEGYFILQQGDNYYYSRAGSLSLDNDGNLVNTANGMFVCDDSGSPITIDGSNINIAADGTITYTDSSDSSAIYDSKIGIATFLNAQGLKKVGENMLVETPASGTANYTAPGTNSGTLISGALEMSNVDLAQEFVDMIVAERGFQANSKTIITANEMLQELINLKR
jgi:flagellar hook protein FlgE